MADVTRADPSESVAVLIAVSRYRTHLPDVPQAEIGVRWLAEEFASPELWGLRRPTRLLRLLNPDRATVLQTVGDAARLVRPPGLLLIYFIGHAETYDGHLCLVTTDGDRSRPRSSMVAVHDLVDEVRRFGPPDISVVLILDCCYAGHAAASIPMRAVRATEAAGWYFIGAADAATPADAGPGRETTPFTSACLDVLKGLPEAGASLRPLDLFDGLTRLLPERPPVHNNAAAGRSPWLVNRAYRRPGPAPRPRPGLDGRRPRRPHMAPPLPPGVVERPALMRRLVKETLSAARPEPVAVTAVSGVGGSGKTVLATQLCHDPSVESWFPGGVLWTMLGHDIRPPDLADKLNELTARLTGVRPTLADPQAAGFQLGEALDAYGKPVLLVLDDVWHDEHVRPFLVGGRLCRRLVTTRVALPSLASATEVRVGLMTHDEAVEVLTHDLDPLPAEVTDKLVRLTDRWPLLLGLANRTISRYWTPTRSVYEAALLVVAWLEQTRPAGRGVPPPPVAGGDRTLITSSIEAIIQSMHPFDRDRYVELCVFPEETDIPYAVLSLLWGQTGGLDAARTELLGRMFIDASLAMPARAGAGLRLHDVLRTYLREVAGPARRTRVNLALVTAAARLLRGGQEPAAAGRTTVRPWWTLPADQYYLWRHLIGHLTDAGLQAERDDLLVDLRWVAARLRRDGPVRVEADLARGDHPDAAALAHAIRCNAHLLTPITPATALDDILASRLDGHPALQTHVDAFARTLRHRPRVANHWPPPDRPDPALLRSIHTGHRYGVRRLHMSPDGAWLATTGPAGDPVVRLWDPVAGHQRFRLETDHRDGVAAVCVAPDGAWLATVGFAGDPVVQVWDPATGRRRLRIDTGHRHGIGGLHVSPDGAWLATTGVIGYLADGGDAVVRVWDPVTGDRRCQFDTGHRRGVAGVHVAPDGGWLATVGFAGDPVVRLWGPTTGEQRLRIETGHRGGVGGVAVAPDGAWLATVGLAGDPVVRVWSTATGERRHELDTGHPRGVGDVRVSPDGGWLATTGRAGDPVVRVWDAATGRRLREVDSGHVRGVAGVAVSPDGGWLATTGRAGDPVVRIWDPVTGELRRRLDTGHAHGVGGVSLSPDGTRLVTTGHTDVLANGGDPVVRVWDPATGGQLDELDTGHPHGVDSVRISPDGAWLVTTGTTDPGGDRHARDPVIRIWAPVAADRSDRFDAGHPHGVGTVHVPPDGAWVATTGHLGRDPAVRVWDAVTGAQRCRLETSHRHGVGGVRVSPDGGWLATVGAPGDPVVRIWDPAAGTQRHRFDAGHPHGVREVYVSPDGDWLATAGFPDDPVVRIWDPVVGRQRHRIDTGHAAGVGGVYVSPDGAWLATTGPPGRDPVVRVWNAATGGLRHEIDTGHPRGVGAGCLSPDGTWLATVDGLGRDPRVRVWDAATGGLRHGIDTGHAAGVGGVHVSPDGAWLATTGPPGRDPVVRVWDAATGGKRCELDTGHAGRTRGVFPSPDGAWLATTGLDGDSVVRIWDTTTGRQLYQLDIGQPGGVRRVHISRDGRVLVAHGSALVVFGLVDSGRPAVIRSDGDIRSSALMEPGPVLVLGTSRGLYALRLIAD